jgi:succinate-semialdehyde dehydrogenase / glutarate-semialdehyde dehydrogenase
MNTEVLESRNPHDNSQIGTYPAHNDSALEGILQDVHDEQRLWSRQPLKMRARMLELIGKALRANVEVHAQLITREMGKPIRQSRAEVEKCAWLCDYYAEQAPAFLAEQEIHTDADQSAVVFRPLGVVLAIMPWNFPYWQAFRFAIPAIAAGNAIVLKHAANVSGCALAMEKLLQDCLPQNLFRTLLVRSERVGAIIADARISAVTFTGSTGAGRKVGAAAGMALKKAVLELGGSDPYIVLADADINQAAKVCAAARLVNAGQSCIAAKRFIVVDAVHDRFVEAFAAELAQRKLGDPLREDTDVGPMARADLLEELDQQVQHTVAEGARLVLGGAKVQGPGAYYPPTLLLDVEPHMTAAREELFGPVAPVIRARDTQDAIAIANASEFGLGGAIFTSETAKGWALACDELEAGAIAVNAQVVSDPRLPFGGIKHSGYGRELGEFGIREFVNVKSVSRKGA